MSKFNYIVKICKEEFGVLPAERKGKIVNSETGDVLIINNLDVKIAELEAKAEIEAKYKAIETQIYSFYPAKQQAQDEKWVSSYTTKLKAQGVDNLEVQIVMMVKDFLENGTSLADVIKDVDDEQKPLFEKLVKVGVRTEWAELCVTEGKNAIAENREPVYPVFPLIKE